MSDEAKLTWQASAYAAVVRAASKHDLLTTDDVWRELRTMKRMPPAGVDRRALGGVMAYAASQRVVEAEQTWRMSGMSACHHRPKRVWRSLVRR